MATSLHDIPGSHVDYVSVPQIASGAATNYVAAWAAPFDCKVTKIQFMCTDAVTGANTNTVHLNVDNASGTEVANLDLDSGTNLTAGVPSDFTISGTTISVSSGSSLRLEAEKVGTGLGSAIDYGVWIIHYQGA